MLRRMKNTLTIWFLCLLMIQTSLSAQSRADKDSLLSALESLPDSVRLERLSKAAYKQMKGDLKIYARLLLEEAERQQNDYYQASALFLLARHYYIKNSDSMRFFIGKAEPLLIATDRLEELFRLKAWNLYAYQREGQPEKIIPEANRVKEQARELNYPEGEEMVDQALANYYIESDLVDDGIRLYEEIFQRMEARNAPLPKRIYIIRQLENNSNVSAEKRYFYLNKLDGYIRHCEENGIDQLSPDLSLPYLRYLYQRSYALAYIDEEKPEKAYHHLKLAEKIMYEGHMEAVEGTVIMQMWLSYYTLVKDAYHALPLADSLIRFYKNHHRYTGLINISSVKGDLLYKVGRGMEAATVYRELATLKDSITREEYYQQLAKLRTRHDIDNLELKNKEMELKAVRTRNQLWVMGGGLSFLALICGLLVYIAWSRHRYGLQLKAAKEKAEEADRLKSAFLANMNHEIRTPLNAIVGFSQVLVEEEDKQTRQELAEIIQNNNELLQRLIVDVLDISKIESNSLSLRYASVAILPLMKEIYNIMQLKITPDVNLLLADCPPLEMETDRNRLTQILTNLLNNAVKHTPSGHIHFGYTLGEDKVCFFVEDTGEGIPADQLERIFSRFVQLSSWSKGVGLGLAICRGLAEKMGGKIEVESEVGKGSLFRVILPVKQTENTAKA